MCAKETIRICIEKGYLVSYLREHEKEVVDMMSELFDEEYQRAAYNRASQKDAIEKGRIEGKAEGKAEERRILAEKMRADGVDEEFIKKYFGA